MSLSGWRGAWEAEKIILAQDKDSHTALQLRMLEKRAEKLGLGAEVHKFLGKMHTGSQAREMFRYDDLMEEVPDPAGVMEEIKVFLDQSDWRGLGILRVRLRAVSLFALEHAGVNLEGELASYRVGEVATEELPGAKSDEVLISANSTLWYHRFVAPTTITGYNARRLYGTFRAKRMSIEEATAAAVEVSAPKETAPGGMNAETDKNESKAIKAAPDRPLGF